MITKLCTLVSEFGSVSEVLEVWYGYGARGMVMRCSRYGNGGPVHVILNGEPLEEVDYFKNLEWQWQLMEDVKDIWYTG